MGRGRLVAGAGALLKVAYGVGSMFAPEWMSRRELAPDARGHPDSRMNLRGLGGYVLAVGGVTLWTAVSGRDLRPALALNLAIDSADTVVGLLEWRDRGHLDKAALGGIGVPGFGVAVWLTARRLGT
jgi:uncharacterized protein YjeT (DUF2065 family)